MNLNMKLLSTPNPPNYNLHEGFSILPKNVQYSTFFKLRLPPIGREGLTHPETSGISSPGWRWEVAGVQGFCLLLLHFFFQSCDLHGKTKKKKLYQIPTSWFTQLVLWSARQGDRPIPSISAAICWLFWDGSSRTVSSAVSPRLSFMLTSIPRKAHQVDQGSEDFQVRVKLQDT